MRRRTITNENVTQVIEPAHTRFGNLAYMYDRPRSAVLYLHTAVGSRLSAVIFKG